MSNKNLFWINWSLPFRYLFLISFSIVIGLVLISSYAWWLGAGNIIDWNVVSTLKESVAEVNTKTIDGLLLTTQEPIFYVTEKYVPTGNKVSEPAAWLFLAGLLIGVALFVSATLRLKSGWFMSGIAVLGALLMGFSLEMVVNQLNKAPFLIPFTLIGGVAYYFNSWAKRNEVTRTLPVLLVLFIVLAVCIAKFGIIEMPFLLISNRAIGVAMLFSAIFIFFISHEIVAVILKITSSDTIGHRNAFPQFIVASAIYLLNALLIFLENANKIDWSNAVIDPWWLFLLSFGLGLWGFRQYCSQTKSMSYQQSGVWIYLGGGLITLSTAYYIYATDNTPFVELMADYISITHLVMGILFFGHVVVNFIQPMKKGLAVHKILYKPPFSRLLLARLVAIFGIFILFSFKSYYSFNQFLSGYYNSLGDYSLVTNELFVAETYFKKSIAYDEFNHKGNYALASLAQSQNDATSAGFYFKQAFQKSGTPYAYAALSESLLSANLYFDATFILKEAASKYPENPYLLTNLGQQFAASSIIDSSYLYTAMAYQHCGNCDVENANLLAFWLENARTEKLDSITYAIKTKNGTSEKANLAAIRTKQKKNVEKPMIEIGKDSVLSVSQFALLYNTIMNPRNMTVLTDSELQNLHEKDENSGYFSDLLFLRAKQNYFYENKAKAIELLSYLTRDETQLTHVYDLTLANWYLTEGIYKKALDSYIKAGDSTSVRNLELSQYGRKTERNWKAQAQKLLKISITEQNYSDILQKAPYNPFVVEKIVEMLNTKKSYKDAYNIAFEASQTNTESILIWKLYTTQALKLGLKSYAEEGLSNIERLADSNDFLTFLDKYNRLIASEKAF